MEPIDKESLDALPIQPPPDMEEAQERSYTHREKSLRDFFVKEYLTDYDAVQAAIRVGYPKSIAREYAVRFMEEPYVLREIAKKEAAPGTEDEEAILKKRIMAGLIREANYRGPGSSQAARVAALAKLAHLNNMEPVKKIANELTGADGQPLVGGAFVIPGLMTPEQWAIEAERQQADLVAGRIAQAKQIAPPQVD